jgi:parafibromin
MTPSLTHSIKNDIVTDFRRTSKTQNTIHLAIYSIQHPHPHPRPTMSDPLALLRTSISASLPAVLLTAAGAATDALATAAALSFPQASGEPVVVPKDAATRYLRTTGGDDSYTIGQLWLAWTERETGVRDYLVKGQAAGGFVAITDRRDVVLFLQGGESARVVKVGEEGEFWRGGEVWCVVWASNVGCWCWVLVLGVVVVDSVDFLFRHCLR